MLFDPVSKSIEMEEKIMVAIVTILNPDKEESIHMTLDPEETFKEIKEKCEDYWLLDDNPKKGEYILVKGNRILNPEESVISFGIQDGDVLKFVRSSEFNSKEQVEKDEEELKLDKTKLIKAGEEWLKKNIGLKPEKLEVVDKDDPENERYRELTLVFKKTDTDEFFTLEIKDGKVKNYMPVRYKRD